MSEDERIVANMGNKIELLEETLRSHRAAIALNPENIDVLFNTGQVLSSLAEALLDSRTSDTARTPARTLLEEAVDIFTRCLASQQHEYEQMQVEIAKATASQELYDSAEPIESTNVNTANEQDSMETSSTSSDGPGEWATVVEPVTPEAMLETCTAQLGALSILLGLYNPSDSPSIEAKAQGGLDTVNTKIPTLINLIQKSPSSNAPDESAPGPTLSIGSSTSEEAHTSPKDDALLAAANLQASIAEVRFRSRQSGAVQYASQVEQLFAPLIKSPPQTNILDHSLVNSLSAYADALIEVASAISDSPQYSSTASNPGDDLDAQWAALTQAQAILTKLSTGSYASALSPSRLADIFSARGDVDLFRFRISLFESAKPAWVKSKSVLVSNAGIFYRGARSYAEKAGAPQVHKTSDVKAVVAEILKEAASGSGVSKEHWKGKGQDVVRVLEQMVEEGIIGKENAEGVLKYV